MNRKDKYGRGSAAANGDGFVDLAPGDTFAALEEQLKRRITDRFDNLALGISASIGSKRNASELAKHLAAGEEEEVHKFAAKNIGALFANGKLGISHDDKKAVANQRWVTRFIRVFASFRFAGNGYLATLTLKDVNPNSRIYAVEAVEINQDVKSGSTPRGAISKDLNSAPFQDLTSQLLNRIAYYVGDVNRTHPKFVGREERFTIERTVELLQDFVSQTVCQQMPSTQYQAPLSFVIPVYKTPLQLLRNCLDSVLKYSQPMELICVLDSPGDPCEAVLDEYAAKEPRMRLLKNDRNRGVSYSRNRGMDAATGRWIVTLDGDDYIDAEMLSSLHGAAYGPCTDAGRSGKRAETGDKTEVPADMAICGIKLVYPDRTEVIEAPGEEKLPAAGFLSKYMCALWDGHLLTTHSNKLYDLELIRREGLRYREDLRINEDIDFVFRYLAFCKNIGMTKGAYMNYVQHDAGKSNITTFRENGLSSSLTVLEDFRKIGGLTGDCIAGMERRLFVHILSFAGLMYVSSSYSDEKKLAELTKACTSETFMELAASVKPQGLKERLAAVLLKRGYIRTYHSLCRLIY